MAHLKSSKKALRQSLKRAVPRKSQKSRMRTIIKKVQAAIGAGTRETAEKLLPAAMKELDKAAKIFIIHKNSASRQKARLSSLISKMAKAKA